MFINIFSHLSDWTINKVCSYDKKEPISKDWEIVAVIKIQSYPAASYKGKKRENQMLFKLLAFFHTPVQQERTCNHKVTECKISLYSCVSDDNYRNWGKNPTAFTDVPAKHMQSMWAHAYK